MTCNIYREECTFLPTLCVQEKPLPFLTDIGKVVGNSGGPLVGNEGLLVDDGETPATLIVALPLSAPGLVSSYRF